MPRTRTDPTVPTDQDALIAREASAKLAERDAEKAALRIQLVEAGREVITLDLPGPATRLLIELLNELGRGRAVSLIPLEAEVTTQQAADLLNVSRPYVVGLIEKGTLPARMVGNQRRVPLRDVLAYKTENRAKRRAALDEMSALHQELGLE